MESKPFRRILLIPGFCEPRWLLLPLKKSLANHAESVEIWRDAIVCRDLERSVGRLRDALLQEHALGHSVAIVSHSFGDWVARQAIAELSFPAVEALVSLAPITAISPLGSALRLLLGTKLVSEVAIMGDAMRSAKNSLINTGVRRMVLWAAVDAWVRPIQYDVDARIDSRRCLSTHMSIVVQPHVHRIVKEFLSRSHYQASL